MKVVQLADVCTITMGQAPPGEAYNERGEGVPLIAGAGDFKGNEIRPSKFTTVSSKLSKPGDIVLSIRASIGAKVIADREYCLGRGVASLRARDDLHGRYLWHWLTRVEPELLGKGRGATFLQISRQDIQEMSLLLPPLEEQRRIAAILDHADALRAKRRQILAHLDSITPLIFTSMFGGGREILARWPVERLDSRLDFLTSGSRGWAKYYSSSGAKFLRIQNVLRDRLNLHDLAHVSAPQTAEARRTLVVPGDVLLSITADLGRTAVVPDGIGVAHINQHLCILRSSTLNPRFLSAFLSSPSGQLQIASKNKEAVKAGLNFDDVRSLKIPVPPAELQQSFSQRASLVDSQRSVVATGVSMDDQLFAALQARAFEG